MPDSAGLSVASGKSLSNWGHVEQSVRKILKTPKRSRVMLSPWELAILA